MASGCWWYFFSKFTEFFDTFFFLMRKRYDQISTLHVIHHGIMPVSVWWGVKFTPGGHSSFFGFLNTFVHIIMYTYYMLAAMGPHMQKYLWWKKYLTVLQMVQFILVMVHAFQLLFKNDCNYPVGFAYFIGAHAIMFYFLFSNFYKEAYMMKKVSTFLLALVRLKVLIKSINYIFSARRTRRKQRLWQQLLNQPPNSMETQSSTNQWAKWRKVTQRQDIGCSWDRGRIIDFEYSDTTK